MKWYTGGVLRPASVGANQGWAGGRGKDAGGWPAGLPPIWRPNCGRVGWGDRPQEVGRPQPNQGPGQPGGRAAGSWGGGDWGPEWAGWLLQCAS